MMRKFPYYGRISKAAFLNEDQREIVASMEFRAAAAASVENWPPLCEARLIVNDERGDVLWLIA